MHQKYTWLVSNKLTLNVSKTEYMIIGSRYHLSKIIEYPNINIGGQNIKIVESTKSLGVVIDEKLNWEEHIDNISKKASKDIGAIKLIKRYIPKENLNDVYNALIKPHFDYCSLVWENCSVTLQQKPPKRQNRADRVISGDSYEIRLKDILQKLKRKPLNYCRLEQLLVLTNKILQKNAQKFLTELFNIAENEIYNLQSNNNTLMLSKPRTNAMKRSFSYKAAYVWNSLPIDLKNTVLTIHDFKKKLIKNMNDENSIILSHLSY